MTFEDVAAHFTSKDGTYQFARWGRPIAPVIFGVEEESLGVLKGAIEAIVGIAGHKMTELDPELGANAMVFFIRDWDELSATPKLDELIPNLNAVVDRLKGAGATQYRNFRFDEAGAIQACFVFLRADDSLMETPLDELALGQAVRMMLPWSEQAFADASPLARLPDSGKAVLRPEIAALIAAAYDPLLPVAANDASHALRLAARMEAAL